MKYVEFSERDAAVLFSMPSVEVDIYTIIRYYIFCNRDAPPPLGALEQCLSKALDVGILRLNKNGTLVLDETWSHQMHAPEDKHANEADALEQWENHLRSRVWPTVTHVAFSIDVDEYSSAVKRYGVL
jgi:hypothetical protein